jgi:EAL domain-containing protein (putative c-di-GMP-specific phosphodiesterase class I)
VASPLAERLCARLREPLVSGGQEVYPSACVGIAISHGEETPGELLRAADTAVRRAKRGGRGGRALYLRTMRDEARARLKLEVEIRQAIHGGEFLLYFQPVIHTFTGQIDGFEALIRWDHPRRGVLAPGAFLPLAEETGLILPMGWQVLELACEQAALWPAPTSVSVNLAAAQLLSRVKQALSHSGLSPTRLKLEITESCLLDHRRVPVHLFETLAEMGVSVMLDDFGTGYCSLSYLERYPLQGLKIDRSFIRELVDNPRRQAITRRILDLGRDLGMDVVAEGIETEAEKQCLEGMRCELLQGYYFARPMPEPDILAFFDEIQRKSA